MFIDASTVSERTLKKKKKMLGTGRSGKVRSGSKGKWTKMSMKIFLSDKLSILCENLSWQPLYKVE